jgi:hypothetical protein
VKIIYLPSLVMKVPDHVYLYAYYFTRIGCTLLACDMYMCPIVLYLIFIFFTLFTFFLLNAAAAEEPETHLVREARTE